MEQGTKLLPAGHDLHTRDGSNLNRRIFLKHLWFVCLAFSPFLQTCDKTFAQGNEMASIGPTSHAMRPPIDAAAPAKTRTASFAVG